MTNLLKKLNYVTFLTVCLMIFGTQGYANDLLRSMQLQTLKNELNRLSLPSHSITSTDLDSIQTTLQHAIGITSFYLQARSPYQNKGAVQFLKEESISSPLVEGLVILEDWLQKQSSIHHIDSALVRSSGKYNVKLLTSFPAQISIGLHFQTKRDGIQPYNLIFQDAATSLQFVTFTNK